MLRFRIPKIQKTKKPIILVLISLISSVCFDKLLLKLLQNQEPRAKEEAEEAEDPEKPPWYDQANWGAQAQAQGELPVAQPAHPVAPGGQPANAQPQV